MTFPATRRTALLLWVGATALVLGFASAAQAATYLVNSTADPGDGTCNVANCTLREAVTAANVAQPEDTINISATGTLGLVSPLPLINTSLRIVGPGSSQLNLRRTGAAPFRILTIYGPTSVGAPETVVSISGLTISNGRAENDSTGGLVPDAGGGIQAHSTTLTLDGVVLTGNSAVSTSTAPEGAASEGGGMYVNSGEVTLRNSLVSSNTVTASASGGAALAQARGGGLHFVFTDEVSIDRTTVRDNTVTGVATSANVEGGGIHHYSGGVSGLLTITNSTISGNHAGDLAGPSPGSGGGITNLATLRITNSTLSGNRADDFGGAIDNYASGAGGAVPANTNLSSVTIANNSANADGNGVGWGGGTQSGTGSPSGVTATNTLYYRNTVGGAGTAPNCGGFAHTSGGYNLLTSAADCAGFTATGDIVNNAFTLGALAGYGGPTLTHALPAGAAAINAGNPATPGSGGAACPATDQRGTSRGGISGRCDIGAYEFVPPPAAPTLTSTNPPSGSNENSPRILGTAVAGTTVTLYANATCTGIPAATGTAAAFASPGLQVGVADNSSTTFRAKATNANGTSACSTSSISYSEVTPPALTSPTGERAAALKKCKRKKSKKARKKCKRKAMRLPV